MPNKPDECRGPNKKVQIVERVRHARKTSPAHVDGGGHQRRIMRFIMKPDPGVIQFFGN